MSNDHIKIITETQGAFPDMSGDSRGNFFMKTTNPNASLPQKEMPHQMTSLLFHSGHPQPNYAHAKNYTEKPNYRTPYLQATETHLKEDKSKEKIEKVISEFEQLYQKERKHQDDIVNNIKFSYQDDLENKMKNKKENHKEMKEFLMKQMNHRAEKQQDMTQQEIDYCNQVQYQLRKNQAIASIYPQIQTIPFDIAQDLKRQKQMEYNKLLEDQVKAKQQQKIEDHLRFQEESRKNQNDYIDTVQGRLDKEKKQRFDKNVECIKISETLQKTQEIKNQVEKDIEEFGYDVLHKGLYQQSPMKPMTVLPEEGSLQKLAISTGFPRAQPSDSRLYATKSNTETSNLLWGYPIFDPTETQKRGAIAEMTAITDMAKDTIEENPYEDGVCEMQETEENIEDQIHPVQADYSAKKIGSGQKLNSIRLGKWNNEKIKKQQQFEADSIFEQKSHVSVQKKPNFRSVSMNDGLNKSFQEQKTLAQVTKETLSGFQEQRGFQKDKKTQAINSLLIKNKIEDYQEKVFGNRLEKVTNQIKEETSINGAQLDALKRFFTDLEENVKKDKMKTDNKLHQNIEYDNRVTRTQNVKFSKRKGDDLFNATLHANKLRRDQAWRNSVYLENGIEGNNGYPAIKVPSKEQEIIQKLEKQKAVRTDLNTIVNSKPYLNSIYDDDPKKTTNQFYNSKFSLAASPEKMVEFDKMQRTQSEFAKKQVSEALKISMDIQQKKKELQQKQMQNIKDVWQKTIKIRQLRSMFSQDFGTTINDDVIHRAGNDPNRNKTFLSENHQAQALAAQIAKNRAASSREFQGNFGLPSIQPSSRTSPLVPKIKQYDTSSYISLQQEKIAKKIEENLAKKSEGASMASTKMSIHQKDAAQNNFYKTTNVFVKKNFQMKEKPSSELL